MFGRLVLIASASVVAFACSRGADGQPFDAIWAYGALAIAYSAGIWRFGPIGIKAHLANWACMEIGVAIALRINPQLEEMAGMLYMVIPMLVLGVAIVAGATEAVLRKSGTPKA